MPPSIQSLPIDLSPWEVDVVDAPFEIDGTELEGMYIVMQADGLVRGAGPLVRGQSLVSVLREACLSPPGDLAPRRPSELRFRRRELLLKAHLGVGERLRVVAELPEVDRVLEALIGRFGPTLLTVPGAESWQPLVARLAEVAPWEVLTDRVAFRFAGGPLTLASAVAMMLGFAGEKLGVVVFPTESDYATFWRRVDAGQPALGHVTVWCCHLDPLDEIPEETAASVRAAGLSEVGGRLPMIFAMDGKRMTSLSDQHSTALRVAVHGMLGAYEQHGEALLQRRTVSVVGVDGVGRVAVQTRLRERLDSLADVADHDEELVIAAEQKVFVTRVRREGEELKALVLKTYKKEAEQLAHHVRAVDAIELIDEDGWVAVRAWAGPHDLGLLTRLRLDDPAKLGLSGRVALVISAGGVKRDSLSERDVLRMEVVRVQAPGAGPAAWPKASATLLEFLEPLELERMPLQTVQHMATVGAVIWSAVARADHAGDPSTLEQTRKAMQASGPPGPEMFEMLVARKRAQFRDDPRLFVVQAVRRDGNQFRLEVVSGVPGTAAP